LFYYISDTSHIFFTPIYYITYAAFCQPIFEKKLPNGNFII